MRSNLTWAELGHRNSSAEAAKKRFRRWAKRGVFDRLMQCSQPTAGPDVLHIDSTSVKCHRTATGARGGAAESIGCSRGGLTASSVSVYGGRTGCVAYPRRAGPPHGRRWGRQHHGLVGTLSDPLRNGRWHIGW